MMVDISFQDILNHTLKRILKLLVGTSMDLLKNSHQVSLKAKWGFDSTSGLSNHSLRPEEIPDDVPLDNFGDSSAFIAAVAPLKLTGENGDIWVKHSPSSPRFCRPVEIDLKKENYEYLRSKFEKYKHQIDHLHTALRI